jgi:hypothetical protein
LSLLNPCLPPDYLEEVAFFLSVGEQAPFSGASEIDELTPKQREFWVKKLSDTYKRQKEEMEKANAKSKGKR